MCHRELGLGPVVPYVNKVGANDLIAELKWLQDSRKRIPKSSSRAISYG
jgi:hypothetical protein